MYFRTLIQIIVLVLLLLVESTASVDCSSQQPSVCAVLPPEGLNINSTHALKLLRNSFVNATGNVTVYAGQTARFIIELDKSIVSDVSPVAYVDGCSDSAQTNCQLIEDNVQMKSIRECVFQNVNQSDDGKEIQFYALSFSLLTQLCYNPPSYLHVLGPPVIISSTSVNPCTGIIVQLEDAVQSLIESDISIQYSAYYASSDGQFLLLLSNFITGSNTIVIPSFLLHNHTGVYRTVVTPINPAGIGTSTSTTISLTTDNYSLEFIVDTVTVEVKNFHHFNVLIIIKVNQSCLLTVPNHFFVDSSCSNDGKVDYPVNITLLLNNANNDQITINHPLQSGTHNCTFTVGDETGHTSKIYTNQSTFHTASYQLYTNSSCVYVQCTFTPGTMAEGCMIVVYNEQGDIVDDILYPHTNQSSSTDYVQLGPFNPGQYSLYIYDYIDGEFNRDDPVFKEQFTIKVIIVYSVVAVSTSSTSYSHSPTASCLNDECNYESFVNTVIIVIPIVIAVLVLLILVVIMAMLFWICNKSKKKSINFESPQVFRESGQSAHKQSSYQCENDEIEYLESANDPYSVTAQPADEKVTISDDNEIKEQLNMHMSEKQGPERTWCTPQLETSNAQGGTYLPTAGKYITPSSEYHAQNHKDYKNDNETSFSNISSDQPLLKLSYIEDEDEEPHFPLFIIPDQNLESPPPTPCSEREMFKGQDTLVFDSPHRRPSLISSGILVLAHTSSQDEHFGIRNDSTSTLTSFRESEGQLLQDKSTFPKHEFTATLKSNYGSGEMLVSSTQVSKQVTDSVLLNSDERSAIVQTISPVNLRCGDTTTYLTDTSADISRQLHCLKTRTDDHDY